MLKNTVPNKTQNKKKHKKNRAPLKNIKKKKSDIEVDDDEMEVYEASSEEDSNDAILKNQIENFLRLNSMKIIKSKMKSQKSGKEELSCSKTAQQNQPSKLKNSNLSVKRKSDIIIQPNINRKNKSNTSFIHENSKKNELNNLDTTCCGVHSKSNKKFCISKLKPILKSQISEPAFPQRPNININPTQPQTDVALLKTHVTNLPKENHKAGIAGSLNTFKKNINVESEQKKVKSHEQDANFSIPIAKKSLEEKLIGQLQGASFRILNEQLYTTPGSEALKQFKEEPYKFKIYHEGYKNQVSNWPINPLEIIISWLRKKDKKWIVADFGCGDASLSKRVKQKVISIDLVAMVPDVIVCDMAHTPLEAMSVNVVVFCLSLMGTNLKEFILEANRVLVSKGILKIAEVESRFHDVDLFLKTMAKYGFRCIAKNQKQNYFWIFDFLKQINVKLKPNTPDLALAPCRYKKR